MLYVVCSPTVVFALFFFNDTATTEIYTLSLHDALPISASLWTWPGPNATSTNGNWRNTWSLTDCAQHPPRSEEHTSELQSRQYLVCRLLLEKKTSIHSIASSRRICPR